MSRGATGRARSNTTFGPGELSEIVFSFVKDRQDRIDKALGISIGFTLGCGAYGCTYELEDHPGLVLKVTADDDEGRMWQKLWSLQKKGEALDGLPYIERVVRLRTDHPGAAPLDLYGVMREGVTPFRELKYEDWSKLRLTKETYNEIIHDVDQYATAAASYYWALADDETYDAAKETAKMLEAAKQLRKDHVLARPLSLTLTRLTNLGIPPKDIAIHNLGVRAKEFEGRPKSIVFFDPGVTAGGEEVPLEMVANKREAWAYIVCNAAHIEMLPIEEVHMERLPGGRASGMRPEEFDPVELKRGTQHELEHTPDVELAREIAMDHLAEDADYYRKLTRMESGMKINRGQPLKLMVVCGTEMNILELEFWSYEEAESAAQKIVQDDANIEEVRIVQEDAEFQANELPRPPPAPRRWRPAPAPAPEPTTPARVQRMVEEYEEEERPFDPEQTPSWRARRGELVVNPRKVTYRVRGTADRYKDRQMRFEYSSAAISMDLTDKEQALKAAKDFTESYKPEGPSARVWVEEYYPRTGDSYTIASWTGDHMRGTWSGGEYRKNGSDLEENARKRCPIGTEVQTLIFAKDDFTQAKAKAWAKQGGFKYGKVDDTEESYRLRQIDPKEFRKGSFRTITMDDGVKAVIGCPKE